MKIINIKTKQFHTVWVLLATIASMAPANPVLGKNPGRTWHGERVGAKFYLSGENIASDKPAATVHLKLTEHSQKMVPDGGRWERAGRIPTLPRPAWRRVEGYDHLRNFG